MIWDPIDRNLHRDGPVSPESNMLHLQTESIELGHIPSEKVIGDTVVMVWRVQVLSEKVRLELWLMLQCLHWNLWRLSAHLAGGPWPLVLDYFSITRTAGELHVHDWLRGG